MTFHIIVITTCEQSLVFNPSLISIQVYHSCFLQSNQFLTDKVELLLIKSHVSLRNKSYYQCKTGCKHLLTWILISPKTNWLYTRGVQNCRRTRKKRTTEGDKKLLSHKSAVDLNTRAAWPFIIGRHTRQESMKINVAEMRRPQAEVNLA